LTEAAPSPHSQRTASATSEGCTMRRCGFTLENSASASASLRPVLPTTLATLLRRMSVSV